MSREAQVRPEYELWFPPLRPGVWYPAATLARTVLDQVRVGEPSWTSRGRIPSDTHFIFRGGDGPRATARHSRRDDQPPSSA
jgi:hypothetical protein